MSKSVARFSKYTYETNQRGGSTAAALSNNTFVPVSGTPPAAAGSGSITAPFPFTPTVTGRGRLCIAYSVSGQADAANRNVAFTISVGGAQQMTLESAVGGDAAFTLASSGTMIVEGLTPGVPVTIEVDWLMLAGTWAPNASEGGITVFELP
jgi:hypothetical protein